MISERQFTRWALALASACALASTASASPPTVTTTITTGGTTLMPMTGTVTIPASLGTQVGSNLFHSFTQFDVGAGDTALFTPAGSTAAVSNIIARINSASASQIFGNVSVMNSGNFAGASLFLINPKGVIFGANSSVNVPGDFVVSTSDYVMLGTGTGAGYFYADPTNPNNSTLTAGTTGILAAPVTAFGFLKGQTLSAANGITVNGGANLMVGGSLQFVTSDFTATSGSTLAVTKASTPLGIYAAAQTSGTADGLVPYLTGTITNYSGESGVTSHGGISLAGTTSSTGTGGSVVIRGGQLVQTGATSVTKAAGNVSIKADSLALTGTVQSTGGTVGIDTTDTASTTGTATLTGGTITSSGGAITMSTGSGGLALDNASSIAETTGAIGTLSLTSTGAIMNSGTISTVGGNALAISTAGLALTGGTISTATGALGIDATGTTSLAAAGMTGSSITSAGGAITLGATSLLDLTLDSLSSITETAGTGKTLRLTSTGTITNGGTISTSGNNALAISATSLAVDGGTISTATGALGINVTGATSLTTVDMTGGSITSAGGAITLGQTSLGDLTLDAASSITETAGAGKTLSLTSTGTITNGGTISTSGGNALSINAPTLLMTGTLSSVNGAITVNTTGTTTLTGGTIQSAGAITLGNTNLAGLVIGGASAINSTGSTVTVSTPGDITMTGGLIETTSTGGTRAGTVTVNDTTGNIALSGGAEIASISSGSGGSGDVVINPSAIAVNASKNLTITGTGVAAFSNETDTGLTAFNSGIGTEAPNTGIFSIANGTGSAGSVSINAVGGIAVSAGGQIASIQTNATTGGNAGAVQITMNPDFFFQTNGGALTVGGVTAVVGTVPLTVPIIFANAANKTASTGGVTINALSSTIELQPGASIQTSTQDGRAGDVSVFGEAITLDPNTDIQSVEFQTSSGDSAITGRTGNVNVEAFNFSLATFEFGGPISIASSSFIQTLASPKSTGFDPVGTVSVYANTLAEGGTNVLLVSGSLSDFDYKSVGATQILAVNTFTLNGANGVDVSGSNKVRVQNVLGFNTDPSLPSTTLGAAGNGIILDGTLNGNRTGVALPIAAVVDSSGTSYTYTIDESDGALAGGNLFLSFSEFNLGFNAKGAVAESVSFDAPDATNIIARVTGGATHIDGTIEEAMGTDANLFLLNSAGVFFTSNASLNLSGAFTVSTADSIITSDGAKFYSLPNAKDAFLTTSVTSTYDGGIKSFVFGTDAMTPEVPNGVGIAAAMLANEATGSGQIQIIAGKISLSSNAILDASQTLLFSTASTGTLTFGLANSLATFPAGLTSSSSVLQETGFTTLGAVTMTSGSVLTVPSPNFASTILIRADSFSLTNSLIVDQTTSQNNSKAGEVLIDVNGAMSILSSSSAGTPSFISTSALGNESGGSVFVDAASLTIAGSAAAATTGILSTAEPSRYYTSDAGYLPFSYPMGDVVSGNAGSVTLDIGGPIVLSNFAQVSTNTTGNGNAGLITIEGPNGQAPQVTVSGGAVISSSANLDPQNNGSFTRAGMAGTINLTASALIVTGLGSDIVSSAGAPGSTLSLTGATGPGGNINITVVGQSILGPNATGDITVSNNGLISASSYNTSLAGEIKIEQRDSTDLADPATNPTTIGGLYVASGGSISTADNGLGTNQQNGAAGTLQLEVQAVTVNDGSITSGTNGAANAGAITIEGYGTELSDFVLIENGGVISSNTAGTSGSASDGNGGSVTINTGALTVTGTDTATSAGSAISTSSTGGTGNGGSIVLQVKGSATVLGAKGDLIVSSGGEISSLSDSVGQAGSVSIMQSNSLDLADPATNPTVIGGVYVNNGSITTAADGTGSTLVPPGTPPGTITIDTQALTVNGANGTITSSTAGISKAGSISVVGYGTANAQFVRVTNGGTISSNTGGTGDGGTITINTGALTVTGTNSEISTNAIASSGDGGSITLTVTGNAMKIGSTGDVMVTNGGVIAALSLATGDAGKVTITQKASTDLADPATNPAVVGGIDVDDGLITTIAGGTGTISAPGSTAGDITLNTQALTMTNGGEILSSTFGLSNAGTIAVNGAAGSTSLTQWVIINGGAQIDSNTSGLGAGGAITVDAGALTLDGTNSLISTSATAFSPTTVTGSGGSIALNVTGNATIVGATGDLAVTNGGTISASSNTTGDAGTVTLTQVGSRDIVYPALTDVLNGGLLLNGGIITTAAAGAGNANSANTQAGDITLRTEALTMTGGSLVLSSTAGASKAGDVAVSGAAGNPYTQFVVMQGNAKIASETAGAGNGGTITIGTGSLLVDNSELSTSATGGTGNGGDITITAVPALPTVTSFVTLQDSGTIASSSQTSGAAGQITISADKITVTGAGAAISTNAGPVGAIGNARGEIALSGQNLFVDKSGLISATTGGFSEGGTITITESNEVDLTTNARIDASSTAAANGGKGGSILIGSDPAGTLNDVGITSPITVNLAGNSVISADSSNTNGGDIGIHTGTFLMDASLVSTSEPNGPASTEGGDITIKATQTFYINNYSYINSNAGQGTGGNIIVDPEFTVLNHSEINAIGGLANGNVFIQSEFVLSGTSSILATGVVDIDSLPLDLTGSLLPLPANLTDEQKRLREKCARAVNHEFSSFIVVGRGGTESAPEEFQPDFGLDSLPSGPGLNVKR